MRANKRITRKVDIHRYLFGYYTEYDGVTITAEYEFTSPLTRGEIIDLSVKVGQPLIKHVTESQYFSMPITDFIRLCRELQGK